MHKCMVLGLDGATWDVLFPLVNNGEMPALKKLLENGCHGILESTIPPYTGTAWASYATGVNPGKHGIFDFVKFRENSYDLKVVSTRDLKRETYYELLSKSGLKSIIINLPISYPPKKINGIIIADFLAPDESKIVYPAHIRSNYAGFFENYSIYPKSYMFDYEEYIKEVCEIEKNRFALAKELFLNEKWDHFFLLFSGTDWVSHSAIGYFFENEDDKIKNLFVEHFIQIDRYLEWFLENLDNATTLFLMSDHGQTTKKRIFYLNEWLKQEGYVVSKTQGRRDPFLQQNIERAAAKEISVSDIVTHTARLLMKTPMRSVISKTHKLIRSKMSINLSYNPYGVDYANSKTFCPAFSTYGVYLNDKRFENWKLTEKESKSLRDKLINELQSLIDPLNSNPILQEVWEKGRLYQGPFVSQAPDILFLPVDGVEIHTDTNVPYLIKKDIHRGGCHTLEGIFLAYGKNINKGTTINNLHICDIAPTLLHIFGVQIPTDLDGKVLDNIFKEDCEFIKRKPLFIDMEKERIKRGIKKLKKRSRTMKD